MTRVKRDRNGSNLERYRSRNPLNPPGDFIAEMRAVLREIATGYGADKRLARVMGTHPKTVARHRRGHCPHSWTRLVRLAGEYDNVLELLLDSAGRPDLADLVRSGGASSEVAALRPELDRLFTMFSGGDAPSYYFWATDGGSKVLHAPAGHADFVRDTLGLSSHTPGDLCAYALRAMGWVAITMSAASSVITYWERRVSPDACAAAGDFFLARKHELRSIRRRVIVNGEAVEAEFPDVHFLVSTMQRAAELSLLSTPGEWRVHQRPLDAITSPRMRDILKAHSDSPARVLGAAASLDVMDTCSVLRVEGAKVVSCWLGTSFGLDPSRIVGHDVLLRPDLRYADGVVRRRALQALDGPVFYSLAIVNEDTQAEYDSLMVPAGDGVIVSFSDIHRIQRLST